MLPVWKFMLKQRQHEQYLSVRTAQINAQTKAICRSSCRKYLTCLESLGASWARKGNGVASCKVDTASTGLFVDVSMAALALDDSAFQQCSIHKTFFTLQTSFSPQIIELLGRSVFLGCLHPCTQSCFSSLEWRRITETLLTHAQSLQFH